MIKTGAITKTQEDFFNKIFTSHFIARVRKGSVGFYCERELETEHNWNILTPKLWPSALCLSRSPGLLNRSPGVHSVGCWLSLLRSSPTLLPATHSFFNSSAFYYLQTPMRRYGHASTPPQFLPISGDRDVSLRYLWNSVCDRHRAEMCSSQVTLFRCISLLVYHGNFLPRPILSAHFCYAISSHNCHWNVSLPSSASPWMAFWAWSKGQNITICRLLQFLSLHTQREDGANTNRLRPLQRNRRSHNDDR